MLVMWGDQGQAGVPHLTTTFERVSSPLPPTPLLHTALTRLQAGTHFDEDVHRGAEAGGSKAAGSVAEPTELSKLVGGGGDASAAAAAASPAKPTA